MYPSPYTLRNLFLYFLKPGSLAIGGPVALIGYMQRDPVESRKWISEVDYKKGLALAQLAPGPLAAQLEIYLGFVHHRVLGATFCGLAFVLPSFVMVVGLGIVYKLYGGLPWMQAIFYGVGSAMIGALAGAVIVIAARSIIDVPTALIAAASLIALILIKKNQEPFIILLAVITGMLLKTFS
jgi:chromate transporter